MEMAQLRADDEWLVTHLNELVDRYAGQVVAIYQVTIVAVGVSETEVYQQVRGREPMPLVFRVPRIEDLQSILSYRGHHLSL